MVAGNQAGSPESELTLKNAVALIIEDDAHSIVTLSGLLKDLGMQFKRNTTGASVLPQIRGMHPTPSLILLDLTLPDADSLALCRSIRADSACRHIPVIALYDGDAQLITFADLRGAGFSGCIPKPFPRKTLGDMLLIIIRGGTLWETMT